MARRNHVKVQDDSGIYELDYSFEELGDSLEESCLMQDWEDYTNYFDRHFRARNIIDSSNFIRTVDKLRVFLPGFLESQNIKQPNQPVLFSYLMASFISFGPETTLDWFKQVVIEDWKRRHQEKKKPGKKPDPHSNLNEYLAEIMTAGQLMQQQRGEKDGN